MELYEFRYKLNDGVNKKNRETLENFYQDIIEELLEIVIFTNSNSIVKVDGFKFINTPDVIPLFLENKATNDK